MVIQISTSVERALAANKPVIALESTLISHGIPRPRNLELAHQLEQTVLDHGAVPATIGLLDGKAKVGLEANELSRLAESDGVEKCSINAMAATLATGKLGATTVASTIYLASKVGIRFMATGGIGGVHRGGEDSLDISNDLQELQRSRVVVVSAGAKIILDLPRTVEALETLGITLVGHQTNRLPGFYVEQTDHEIQYARDADSIAAIVQAQADLDWPASILVCNPPPRELSLPNEQVELWLSKALGEARMGAACGKEETPYLLKRLAELSHGKTVTLNEGLVLSNAALAAEIACSYYRQ